ncbi:amino acid racemase [Schleiferilactobacillus shenzhenensis]|uniref:Aspartate racemase n=1 Tax=Schleiferilactobacillus shenzhenensis LY-73 TaxID=1231336 RepID=U4TIF5_9LACO|nr:amino acid racemase [Schleiferilactobacillus shenzhenensis]ERL64591.1 aspartate racemase [Schleiferilactobacillus shenzhenensis LY-73]
MEHFFTVIGGMGTPATESYVRLLNARTPAHRDQDYLNYILVNHATVPDRTAYILDHSQSNFLPPLLADIKQQASLHPDFIVIVCNTAHYFYKELAAAAGDVPLLHMPHVAVNTLTQRFPKAKKVGLIATAGTMADHIYEREIQAAGYEVVLGNGTIQDQVTELIYHDIKERNHVDGELYHTILREMMVEKSCDLVVLGCTELSLAQEKAPDHPYPVIDPQSIIADESLRIALALRRGETVDFTPLVKANDPLSH